MRCTPTAYWSKAKALSLRGGDLARDVFEMLHEAGQRRDAIEVMEAWKQAQQLETMLRQIEQKAAMMDAERALEPSHLGEETC